MHVLPLGRGFGARLCSSGSGDRGTVVSVSHSVHSDDMSGQINDSTWTIPFSDLMPTCGRINQPVALLEVCAVQPSLHAERQIHFLAQRIGSGRSARPGVEHRSPWCCTSSYSTSCCLYIPFSRRCFFVAPLFGADVELLWGLPIRLDGID